MLYFAAVKMSLPDYNQTLDDHRALLILVKQVGCHLKPKTFSEIYGRISHLEKVNIHSQQRTIQLRYTKVYPPESNDWGEFQVSSNAKIIHYNLS